MLASARQNFLALGGLHQHRHHQRRRIEDVDEQDSGFCSQIAVSGTTNEIDDRGDRRLPQRDANHRAQKANRQQARPVQLDVLHEAVRPAPQLLAHEVEVVRLDRVAHRFRHEAHGCGRADTSTRSGPCPRPSSASASRRARAAHRCGRSRSSRTRSAACRSDPGSACRTRMPAGTRCNGRAPTPTGRSAGPRSRTRLRPMASAITARKRSIASGATVVSASIAIVNSVVTTAGRSSARRLSSRC